MDISDREDSSQCFGLHIDRLPMFDIFIGVTVSLIFLCVTYYTYFTVGVYVYNECYDYMAISLGIIVTAVLVTSFSRYDGVNEVLSSATCFRIVRIAFGVETIYISAVMIIESVKNREGVRRIRNANVIASGSVRYLEVVRTFIASKKTVRRLKDFTLLYCLTFCVPHILFSIFVLARSIVTKWNFDYWGAQLDLLLLERRNFVDTVVHLIFIHCYGIALAFSFCLPIRVEERVLPPLWICLRSVCKFLWMFLGIVSKMIAILIFTQTFGTVIFVLIALHWSVLLVFAIMFSPGNWSRNAHGPGFSVWDNFVYKPILVLAYTFTFIHPREGMLENVYGIYFLANFLINLWMMYGSYGKQETRIDVVLLTKGVVCCVCSSFFHYIRTCVDAHWPLKETVQISEDLILETTV